MSSLTWFQLLDATDGLPYKGTSTDFVSLPPGNVVDQFRKAVKAKNLNKLSAIDASDLHVFRNKASFDQRNEVQVLGEGLLKSSLSMAGLGTTEEEALAVVVPPPFLPNKSAQQMKSTGKGNIPTTTTTCQPVIIMSSLTWFQLLDATDGLPYKGTSTSSVSLSPGNVVGHFRKAVKAKYDQPGYLKDLPSSVLHVYRNKASFDQRNEVKVLGEGLLKSSLPMAGLGTTEEEALAVVVPPPFLPNKSAQQIKSTAMDVDSPAMAAQEALNSIHAKITELLETQNILISSKESSAGDGQINPKAYNSMETLADPLLDLDIHRRRDDGAKPDLLFSEKILKDAMALGIAMPVKKLKLDRLTVVVGVRGCGKTRACYDLCRRRWGLYFDCIKDADFAELIKALQSAVPKKKTEESQMLFEEESGRLIRCLLISRLIVLEFLRQKCGLTEQLEPFDWFCHQRSRPMQDVFSCVFGQVTKFSRTIIFELDVKLIKKMFARSDEGLYIFDESQHLLEVMKADYRPPESFMREISSDGKMYNPRSLFTFLTVFMMRSLLQSIFCGADKRTQKIELLVSAAGGGKDVGLSFFSDFTYLSPDNVLSLLKKWLVGFDFNAEKSRELLARIGYHLQGRPGHLISLLYRYLECRDLSVAYESFMLDMTTKSGSLVAEQSYYSYWKKYLVFDIEPLAENDEDERRRRQLSDVLVKLCVSSLFGDKKSTTYAWDFDLLSTCLVMLSSNRYCSSRGVCMAEPVVLAACINYMVDEDLNCMMKYFTKKIFESMYSGYPSAKNGSHLIEFVIALRFMKAWWREDEFRRFLPPWFDPLSVPKPDLLLDCQRNDPGGEAFLRQLGDEHMPYLLLPHANAGPDLRYSVFSCCVKTTVNSRFKMFVSAAECDRNFQTMKPENWYSPQQYVKEECENTSREYLEEEWEYPFEYFTEEECEYPSQQSIKEECGKLIEGRKFIQLIFELPYSDPSLTNRELSLTDRDDSIIVVNLNSEFALHFFGEDFVNRYMENLVKWASHTGKKKLNGNNS